MGVVALSLTTTTTVGWIFFYFPARDWKVIRRKRPIGFTRTIATERFTDVTEKAGLKAAGWANGVCVADYNNDGFDDIFCTYFGQNRLYRNNGDGTFTDVTKQAGLSEPGPARWGAGCAFLDYNRDGHLDLFVSNYIRFSFEHAPAPGENSTCNWKGIPVNCGPRGLPRAGILFIAITAMGRSLMSRSKLASRQQPRATG